MKWSTSNSGEVVESEVLEDGSSVIGTLEDLMVQAGDINSFSTLVMEIASQGGSVEEGLKIIISGL